MAAIMATVMHVYQRVALCTALWGLDFMLH
jgi:hypothetical protein